jgi:hypothetical protein
MSFKLRSESSLEVDFATNIKVRQASGLQEVEGRWYTCFWGRLFVFSPEYTLTTCHRQEEDDMIYDEVTEDQYDYNEMTSLLMMELEDTWTSGWTDGNEEDEEEDEKSVPAPGS